MRKLEFSTLTAVTHVALIIRWFIMPEKYQHPVAGSKGHGALIPRTVEGITIVLADMVRLDAALLVDIMQTACAEFYRRFEKSGAVTKAATPATMGLSEQMTIAIASGRPFSVSEDGGVKYLDAKRTKTASRKATKLVEKPAPTYHGQTLQAHVAEVDAEKAGNK